ncbi:MAG: Hpt domain-containing protein [Desulfovibrio sp.]|jgi:chemotaxis protein histidine kinase CheA|nr:Hpt domain-containing protein [Desulfovibrio sp.]
MTIDPMVEEFFAEVNDKYYPQVIEGLELLDSGEVGQGLEMLARPIHTIKGVTGFMSGFEPASTFTHKVEDFLKALQSGDIEHNEHNITLAGRGVTAIFQVLEQIRTEGALNQQEADEILALLSGAGSGEQQELSPLADCITLHNVEGVAVIRVACPRMHLEEHCNALNAQLLQIKDDTEAVLDVTEVRTIGSSVWHDMTAHAARLGLTVVGMRGSCRSTFHSWGFDRYFETSPSMESYLKRRTSRREQGK